MASASLDRHLLILAVMVWGSLAVIVPIVFGFMTSWPTGSSRWRGGSGRSRR
jgi:hypothetical protein